MTPRRVLIALSFVVAAVVGATARLALVAAGEMRRAAEAMAS